jgi:hypothetical protein
MPRLISALLHERNAEPSKQCLDLEKAVEWSRDLLGRFGAASGEKARASLSRPSSSEDRGMRLRAADGSENDSTDGRNVPAL